MFSNPGYVADLQSKQIINNKIEELLEIKTKEIEHEKKNKNPYLPEFKNNQDAVIYQHTYIHFLEDEASTHFFKY